MSDPLPDVNNSPIIQRLTELGNAAMEKVGNGIAYLLSAMTGISLPTSERSDNGLGGESRSTPMVDGHVAAAPPSPTPQITKSLTPGVQLEITPVLVDNDQKNAAMDAMLSAAKGWNADKVAWVNHSSVKEYEPLDVDRGAVLGNADHGLHGAPSKAPSLGRGGMGLMA